MEWLNLFVKMVLWTATLLPPADELGDVAERERPAAIRLEASPAGDESPFSLDHSQRGNANPQDPRRPDGGRQLIAELYRGNRAE